MGVLAAMGQYWAARVHRRATDDPALGINLDCRCARGDQNTPCHSQGRRGRKAFRLHMQDRNDSDRSVGKTGGRHALESETLKWQNRLERGARRLDSASRPLRRSAAEGYSQQPGGEVQRRRGHCGRAWSVFGQPPNDAAAHRGTGCGSRARAGGMVAETGLDQGAAGGVERCVSRGSFNDATRYLARRLDRDADASRSLRIGAYRLQRIIHVGDGARHLQWRGCRDSVVRWDCAGRRRRRGLWRRGADGGPQSEHEKEHGRRFLPLIVLLP